MKVMPQIMNLTTQKMIINLERHQKKLVRLKVNTILIVTASVVLIN